MTFYFTEQKIHTTIKCWFLTLERQNKAYQTNKGNYNVPFSCLWTITLRQRLLITSSLTCKHSMEVRAAGSYTSLCANISLLPTLNVISQRTPWWRILFIAMNASLRWCDATWVKKASAVCFVALGDGRVSGLRGANSLPPAPAHQLVLSVNPSFSF